MESVYSVSTSLSHWLNCEPHPLANYNDLNHNFILYYLQSKAFLCKTGRAICYKDSCFSKFHRLYLVAGTYLKAHPGSDLKECRAQSRRGPCYGEETGMEWEKEIVMGLGTSPRPASICQLYSKTNMDGHHFDILKRTPANGGLIHEVFFQVWYH